MSTTYYDLTSTNAAIAAAPTIAQLNTALAPLGTAYDLAFTFWATDPSGSDAYAAGSTLWTDGDIVRARLAATLLARELVKYPPAFVQATALTAVNVVREVLRFNGSTNSAAYAYQNEFWTRTLTTLATMAETENFQRIFHHEFFHVIDATWPTSLNYAAWRASNPAGFVYGQPWGTTVQGHPLGFIDAYATLTQVEDSAQIHSALMAQPRFDLLRSWLSSGLDPTLQTKVQLHHAFLASRNAVMGTAAYYEGINGVETVPTVPTVPDVPLPPPPPDPVPVTPAGITPGVGMPVVKVWRNLDGGQIWGETGQVGNFEELTFAPAFNDLGDWSLKMPFDDQALLFLRDRIVTIDWRGKRSTWRISSFKPAADEDTGEPMLEVSGVGALSMLGWRLTWPNPGVDINSQPVIAEEDPAPYNGPAGQVISLLVSGNLRGLQLHVPGGETRGRVVQARPLFDNLLELALTLAEDSGIGVDVGLVDEGPMRARLTLLITAPEDKTRSVLLTAAAGTLDRWEQADTEPAATEALVGGPGPGGADRYFLWPVTTDASNAAATTWGGHREVFVDGTSTLDDEELAQSGRKALTDGAETRTLSLVAAEADQMQAFTHYDVGDKATAEVLTGAAVADVITSIKVTCNDDGVTVEPGFGDPAATNALLDIMNRLGELRRAMRHQERK